ELILEKGETAEARMLTETPRSTGRDHGLTKLPTTSIKKHMRGYCVLLLTIALLTDLLGCGYQQPTTPPNGKISVQAVSGELVKKLAEPNAGLSGHKVTI